MEVVRLEIHHRRCVVMGAVRYAKGKWVKQVSSILCCDVYVQYQKTHFFGVQ